MKRTRFARQRKVAPTVVIGAVVLAGVLGVPSASGGQPVPDDGARVEHESAELLYHCETGTRQHEVKVSVGLSLPESSPVEATVEPTDVTVRLALGEPVVAELAERGVSSVTGSTRFSASVATEAQDDAVPGAVAFPELAIDSTPLPDNGELRVAATGVGPEITPTVPGELTFSAGRLNLILGWQPEESEPEAGSENGPDDTDDGNPDDGPETEVPAVAFDCAPESGQDVTIGSFAVRGEAQEEPGDEQPSPTPGAEAPSPDGRAAPKNEVAQGEVPDECEQISDEGVAWCAYLGGYSNIDGLGAASRIEPGIVNLAVGSAMLCEDRPGFCQTTVGELNYQGKKQFPPSRNHFHAFDFMPNSAMVELSQLSPMEIEIFFLPTPPYDGLVTVNVDMSIRVYDVEVNGTALEVGDNCRTEEPMGVVLTATYPSYDVDSGGILDGFTDIPPFSGCGKNGELDALMTGLISGEEYYVKMTQGAICELRNGNGCPPPHPELQQ
ncbi:DUF6801 domain-containing protein [Saccharomonospora sp.]|uniref:DUF6801 domain-containing protein n=1 Tax=Saccharomonospora sp. TaxID=33913 RepID=UPI002625E310|nr:DUF6801 domain-containing protein [Saccharomonospora sp.]